MIRLRRHSRDAAASGSTRPRPRVTCYTMRPTRAWRSVS